MTDAKPEDTPRPAGLRTVIPIVWIAIALAAVLALLAWLVLGAGPVGKPAHAVVAPSEPAAPN